MEIFLKEAERDKKVLHNQGGPLNAYLAFFRESFLVINGKVRMIQLSSLLSGWIRQDLHGCDYCIDEGSVQLQLQGTLSGAESRGSHLTS